MGGVVKVRESHCVRTRYSKSECSRCADACPHQAISFAPSPVIDKQKCTDCTACVAACRTAALDAPGVLFWETLRQLVDVPGAVLGCSEGPQNQAHARIPCIAYLDAARATALAVFLPDGVTVNLSACGECENAAVRNQASDALVTVKSALPVQLADRLRVVTEAADVGFRDPVTDRRDFFRAMGGMIKSQAALRLAQYGDTDIGATPYWEKIPPSGRVVLERVVKALGESGHADGLAAVSDGFAYRARVSENCQLCFGCVGMCPNGALDSFDEDAVVSGEEVYTEELRLITARCSGCGLCEATCASRAISIELGVDPEMLGDPVTLRSSSDQMGA